MFGKKEELEVLVDGMSCMHCVSSVEKAIGNINGVKKNLRLEVVCFI